MDLEKISSYQFAPITTVDVELSFSTYKRILDDRRHNLLDINIETLIIVNFTNFRIKVFKFFFIDKFSFFLFLHEKQFLLHETWSFFTARKSAYDKLI